MLNISMYYYLYISNKKVKYKARKKYNQIVSSRHCSNSAQFLL